MCLCGELVMAAKTVPVFSTMQVLLVLHLAFVRLPLMTGGKPDVSIVSSCASCTARNPAAVWCPDDMTCQLASNCSCGTVCMGFPDCFVQETSCDTCVQSSGVFCTRPNIAGKQCFFPDMPASRVDSAAALLQQCGNSCETEGDCIAVSTQCPNAPMDITLLVWLVVNVATTTAIAVLIIILVYRAVKGKSFQGGILATVAVSEQVCE